jgi:hypothetical protein
MKKAVLVALALLIMAPVANAQDLTLTKGTMQLGGVATFDIDMNMPEEGDSVTGFALNVAPGFGYFIMDNLELFAGLNAGMGFGDMYENAAKTFGFDLGAKYFMCFGPVVGYAGLGVGMGFVMTDDQDVGGVTIEGATTKNLVIGVPLGVLYPLNEHVAMDLGAVINYNMSLEDGGGAFLNVPIGYLGVQSFF